MEPINGRIVRAAGTVLRQLGQAVDRFGLSMQGKEGYVERCECAHGKQRLWCCSAPHAVVRRSAAAGGVLNLR